jgi:hypothetical protein
MNSTPNAENFPTSSITHGIIIFMGMEGGHFQNPFNTHNIQAGMSRNTEETC